MEARPEVCDSDGLARQRGPGLVVIHLAGAGHVGAGVCRQRRGMNWAVCYAVESQALLAVATTATAAPAPAAVECVDACISACTILVPSAGEGWLPGPKQASAPVPLALARRRAIGESAGPQRVSRQKQPSCCRTFLWRGPGAATRCGGRARSQSGRLRWLSQ